MIGFWIAYIVVAGVIVGLVLYVHRPSDWASLDRRRE